MSVRPFQIAIPDEQIVQLRTRLAATRWPDAIPGMDWQDGTDRTYLRHLVDHWVDHFDWRAQEARLNHLPQFVTLLDGLDVHFIHVHGRGPRPFPLILTHGYPGTGFDMASMIPLLTDPAAHGGRAEDAFDVIVPSIPGYGFSQRPDRVGFGPARVAEMWAMLMARLGYDRYAVYGEDWGAAVSTWLAYRHPARVAALHLSFIPGRFRPATGDGQPPVTAEEQAFLDRQAAWFKEEGGYHALQSTKPQTPAYPLNDSPAGLAAWFVEKQRDWSDCGGDVEKVFPIDTLLTNLCICWFTQTIGSVMRFYREDALAPTTFKPGERVAPPLGLARMPKEESISPPRSWVERVFDVARWTLMPRGGHFAAQEVPDALASDIRAFFAAYRGS